MPVLKGSPNKGIDVMHKKRIVAQPERRQGYARALNWLAMRDLTESRWLMPWTKEL